MPVGGAAAANIGAQLEVVAATRTGRSGSQTLAVDNLFSAAVAAARPLWMTPLIVLYAAENKKAAESPSGQINECWHWDSIAR